MNLRRPLALLVPLALSAVLLVGCGDEDAEPDENAGESTSETSETSETSTPTDDASETVDPNAPVDTEVPDSDSEELPDGDDGEGGDGRTDVPADAAALCGSFQNAYDTINRLAAGAPSSGSMPPGLVDAYHQWGEELADVDLPGSFTDEQRDGVQVMSQLLTDVPDDAGIEDFDRAEQALSDADEDKVDSVVDYVGDNCDIAGMAGS